MGLAGLTHLGFACLNGPARSLAPLAAALPSLRHLDLSLPQWRNEASHPTRLLLAPLTALTQLSLAHCRLMDLAPLQHCPSLKVLDLVSCQMSEGGARSLACCTQLNALTLSSLEGLSQDQAGTMEGALTARGTNVNCV